MNHTREEGRAWLGFAYTNSIGPRRFGLLMDATKQDVVAAYALPTHRVATLLGTDVAETFDRERHTINIDAVVTTLSAHNVRWVARHDAAFPNALKKIFDPPIVLFFRGTLPDTFADAISIVGSRKPTHYGRELVRHVVHHLAPHRPVLISGLAFGIDAAVHEAALAEHLTTVAVLPSGLDHPSITPAHHVSLAKRLIEQGGCLVSEYAPGTPAHIHHFPIRNRLIAGWSRATLIPEATLASGTMLTAHAALRENRDVLAFPGPITSPLSEGPNTLIKDGAAPVTSLTELDLLLGYQTQTPRTRPSLETLSEQERIVLTHLSNNAITTEEIARVSTQSIPILLQHLTTLELKGCVMRAGSGYWRRT